MPDKPNATHYTFPYHFSDVEGISFKSVFFSFDGDLLICYSSMSIDANHYIDCWCSRWDVQNYNVIVETWVDKTDINTIRSHIRPGAVGELYTILGRPRFFDKSWQGKNTILLKPNKYTQYEKTANDYTGDNQSSLDSMRDDTLIFVKNITEHPIGPNNEFVEIKIEGYISGSGSI